MIQMQILKYNDFDFNCGVPDGFTLSVLFCWWLFRTVTIQQILLTLKPVSLPPALCYIYWKYY